MSKRIPDEIHKEAIRLRVEDRLSIKAVCARLGVSQSTVSGWLKPYPLTTEECRERMARPSGVQPVRSDESQLHKVLGRSLPRGAKPRVSEAAILLRLVIQGWEVYGSPFDGDKFDWVVNTGTRLLRLQVKSTSKQSSGSPFIRLRCSNGRASRKYRDGEFDFIVGYDFYSDTAYVWSWAEVKGKTSISVALDAAERWDKISGSTPE